MCFDKLSTSGPHLFHPDPLVLSLSKDASETPA
jgi:hypothetical protein